MLPYSVVDTPLGGSADPDPHFYLVLVLVVVLPGSVFALLSSLHLRLISTLILLHVRGTSPAL